MPVPQRRLVAVALGLAAVLVAGCDAASPDSADPADPVDPADSAGSAGSAGSEGLPAPRDGQLVRVLGDGSGEPLRDAEHSPDTQLHRPGYLGVGSDGQLVGLQEGFPTLFALTSDGVAEAVVSGEQDDALLAGRPFAALAREDHLLVLTESGGTASVGSVSLADGALQAITSLTEPETDRWAAAFLDLPSGTHVQWDDTWWRLTGGGDDGEGGDGDLPTGAERMTPPVKGILASARTSTGILALTETELVELDESLEVVQRSPWSMPDDAAGQTVTSAVSDGTDGLYVTTAGLPTSARYDSGSVLHVAPAGVTVLATGHKPAAAPSTNCEDASVDAQSSHLAQPVSVAVWEERLMIADYRCNSVLQLTRPSPE